MPHLDNSTAVHELIRDKVRRNELGAKTGKGFYDWQDTSIDSLKRRVYHALIEIERWTHTA